MQEKGTVVSKNKATGHWHLSTQQEKRKDGDEMEKKPEQN
jgi:hypothetical protein